MTESNKEKLQKLFGELPRKTAIEDLSQALSMVGKRVKRNTLDGWKSKASYRSIPGSPEIQTIPLNKYGVLIFAYIKLLRDLDISHEDIREELSEPNWLENHVDELIALNLPENLNKVFKQRNQD